MNERAAIGGGGGVPSGGNELRRLQGLAAHLGVAGDPLFRERFADVFIHTQVARYNNERALSAIRSGSLPGPELSIAKLSLTENLRRIADLAAAVLGPRLIADSGEWGTYAWSRFVLGVPGIRVAGGTDEIMRNILAERVLGLPKDPSPQTSPLVSDTA
jgi:alkylation response protein AidB-like acyl-CoA dehydrogenase